MIDKKLVINGLECAKRLIRIGPGTGSRKCRAMDACDNAIAMLKEQEPVKPKYTPKSIYSWECGVCAEPFDRIANYCPKCGRAVKWDADGETQVPG